MDARGAEFAKDFWAFFKPPKEALAEVETLLQRELEKIMKAVGL